MIAFIDDHRNAHGVEPICRVLPIVLSTYHAHATRHADPAKWSARARSDAALMVEIRRVFEENFGVYGVRKVWRLFAALGLARGDGRYAKLLKQLARAKLLILDDWGPEPPTAEQARDLLEIVEDRYDAGSVLITSQVPSTAGTR